MARIVNNRLLHPTIKTISNWNRDFRTSDGPNNSSFISLDDIGIPYDSHYTSRIVLPADTTDFLLNYGSEELTTFLIIKVTYNGNYDYANEDDFDPLYYYDKNTYNINYYYEYNDGEYSGQTYPINRLLILNGSANHKIPRIYLNNPLDHDVVLDILHANVSKSASTPINSALTLSNLYYSDIITNQVVCTGSTQGTTTITTTTLNLNTTTTTTDSIIKELMSISKSYDNISGNYIYLSTGNTLGLFDYYKDGQWIFAGEETYTTYFNDLTGIERIRFYFDLNTYYYGILKTDLYEPYDHNNGLYFIDISAAGGYLPTFQISTTTTTTTTTEDVIIYNSGSTEFIIKNYMQSITGISVVEYTVDYSSILNILKEESTNSIYIQTIYNFYTLRFLTNIECDQAYYRVMFVYESYFNGDCSYLTDNYIVNNGVIVVN
jgi:hypothetical protein